MRHETASSTLTIREPARPFDIHNQPTPEQEYQLGTTNWGGVNVPGMALRTPFAMRQVAAFLREQARESERIGRERDREYRREAKRERRRRGA